MNKNEFAVAVCDIHFSKSTFAIAVKADEKELAETEMVAAYDCWALMDIEKCIIPEYDEEVIQKTCIGDFIIKWLEIKGIKADEVLDLVPLDGYCFDNPPADCTDVSEWRDERVCRYWFDKTVLSEYLSREHNTTVKDYINLCTPDDVDCDIIQEIPFVIKSIVIKGF